MSSVLDDLIQAELQGQSQGSEVTAAAVVTAIGQMTSSQKEQVLAALGVDPVPTKVTVTGSTPTITPVANTVYKCGTLTSLTITNPPATGHYNIRFTSGSTATTTTIPSTIHGLESFAAEANTRYEIDVEDNYAVVGHWAVSA